MEIILGKTAGFCYGVERAVSGVKEESEGTYCLGEIVHNKNVIKDLEKQGIKFIENIEEAKGKTIIRAHGVPKDVYEIAKKNNIELKDLTCLSVLKIHQIAEEYKEKGYFIIVVGKKEHPEVLGIESHCGDKYIVINSSEELENLSNFNYDNVLIVSQTTFNSKVFDEIILRAKEIFKGNIVVKKTICNSTKIRQKETEEIAKKVDVMIIIGDKMSSNTTKLYNISCDFCKKVLFIRDVDELNLKEIQGVNTVGIMAGASTPKEDIEKVKNVIGGIV